MISKNTHTYSHFKKCLYINHIHCSVRIPQAMYSSEWANTFPTKQTDIFFPVRNPTKQMQYGNRHKVWHKETFQYQTPLGNADSEGTSKNNN